MSLDDGERDRHIDNDSDSDTDIDKSPIYNTPQEKLQKYPKNLSQITSHPLHLIYVRCKTHSYTKKR